jgi:hypothetical protein
MYVRTYVRMYVCLYVCMSVCIYKDTYRLNRAAQTGPGEDHPFAAEAQLFSQLSLPLERECGGGQVYLIIYMHPYICAYLYI